MFLGDSLTAGYGLAEDEAFPALLGAQLRERGQSVRVVNAGVSGDTSAGGLRRLPWLLTQRPDVLVVGVPYNDDGSPGTLAPGADAFAAALRARYGLPVERVDERYSSTAAQSLLREQRASGQRRRQVAKGDIDSAAAAVMLASWLEQQP